MTINFAQVRALVQAQLRLDLRHPKTGATQTSRAALTVITYSLSSFVLALSLAERGAGMTELLFAGTSFTAVLAAFGIAGSYDDLMGRPRDHARSLTYPVSESTLYTARLANVGIFAVVMCLSAALPLALLAGWQFGAPAGLWTGAALVAVMLGMTYGVLAAVWLFTLVAPLRILRLTMTAVRALLIGALVLGYQWVATQPELVAEVAWWPAHWVVLAWQGAPAGTLLLGGSGALLALAFGLFFPTRFVRILKQSAEAESVSRAEGTSRSAPALLERWAVRSPESRAGFGFAASALAGDRLVRGRAWPAALLALVFAGFSWWSGGLGDLLVYGVDAVLWDPAVQMHLSVLTILLFAAQAAMQGMQISDQPEAAWTFEVLPVRSHRALQIGAQQALLFRVMFPLLAILTLLLTITMPVLHAVLHTSFWFAGCALLTRVQALTRRQAPFTRQSDKFSAGERFVPLLLAVPAAIVLLILQGVTFVDPLSAVLLVVGMLVFHSALGQFAQIQRQPGAASSPAGVPAFEHASRG